MDQRIVANAIALRERAGRIKQSCGPKPDARDSACLDFALSADRVDPTRVNVFERWARPEDLDAFRASGDPDNEPVDFSRIRRFEIEQHSVERHI